MDKKVIQIENITSEDLFIRLDRIEKTICDIIKSNTNISRTDKNAIMTRKEVADMFGVSLVTVQDWSRKGFLKPYKIGSRVRFKRSEVLESLATKL